jgi:hypothetical protein
VIYFPHRRAAVALNPFFTDTEMLKKMDAMRAAISKPRVGPPVVVSGFAHCMHVLWNDLPALEHAAHADLSARMKLAVLFEQFGPAVALFPEFAGITTFLSHGDLLALNREHRLLVGLAGWTIRETTQRRVRQLAEQQVAAKVIESRDRFCAEWTPVFWLSVKLPKRTLCDQAVVLARLIRGIRQEYADAGFVLNGTSIPSDAKTNPNYVPAFSKEMERATCGVNEIIEDVLRQCDANVRRAVRVVSGVSVCEEIVWGEAADFYFCHGGTMQNKIGWVHRIPGLVHSNAKFLYSFKRMPPPVENGPGCFFLSDGLIADAPAENYNTLELKRKDQDYSFTDIDKVVREVIDAFRVSREYRSTRYVGLASPPPAHRQADAGHPDDPAGQDQNFSLLSPAELGRRLLEPRHNS